MKPLIRRWVLLLALSMGILFFLYSLADTNDVWVRKSKARVPPITHVDWKSVPQQNPIKTFIPIPSGAPAEIPKIQFDFPKESAAEEKERVQRQKAVKDTFLKAWEGYKQYAWLQDEVQPKSKSHNNKYGGWGATLVDNLDTLLIMGLEKEFVNALQGLKKIDYTISTSNTINVFETTIRHLGGLLSAHDLDHGKHSILLNKAIELGETLYASFDTPNRLPMSRWSWKASAFQPETQHEASGSAVVAEVGSLSLEFTRLTQLTGDARFFDAVQRISDIMESQQNHTYLPGLWPTAANSRQGTFKMDRSFTFGAMADSLYEYFPKQHMILGGLKDQYRRMYETAIEVAKEHLFFRVLNKGNQKLLVSGTAHYDGPKQITLRTEGQHLTCFVGGMVGIAAKIFDRPDEMAFARQLTDACIWAYESMPTGIMPESFLAVPCNASEPTSCEWSEDAWYKGIVSQLSSSTSTKTEHYRDRAARVIKERKLPPGFAAVGDPRYLLRPEAIESVFILYRITGDKALQDHAWNMFRAVKEYTATEIGAASIRDVRDEKTGQLDECESFWMAETLKYYYLIFSEPSLVSLDEYVFNTEAHPLRRPT